MQSRSSLQNVCPLVRFALSAKLIVLQDSLYSRIGLVPTIDIQHPGSVRNVTALRHWIQDCEQNHEKCRISFDGQRRRSHDNAPHLPTRVIKVTAVPNSFGSSCILAKLFVTGGSCGQYLTLSHRWSSAKSFQLIKENFRTFLEGIPNASCSPTFNHAICMTKLLGFEYLWIDSLCIIQDDDEDLKSEISRMGEIFENAACMLAAVDTVQPDGSDSGLFDRTIPGPPAAYLQCSGWEEDSPSLQDTSTQDAQDIAPFTDELGLKIANPQGWHIVRHSKWHGRGWVMQERMLSRRTIYFTKYKLLWDCRQSNGDEDRHGSIHWSSHRNMPGDYHQQCIRRPGWSEDQSSFQQWSWLVEEYSKCQLSKETDRPLAIAGISRKFQSRMGAKIEQGILLDVDGSCVLSSLLWIAESRDRGQFREFSSPSWSWMGLNGPVAHSTTAALPTPVCKIVHGSVLIEGERLLLKTALGPAVLGNTVASMGLKTQEAYLPILGSSIYAMGTYIPRDYGFIPGSQRVPNLQLPSQTRILKTSRSGKIIGWATLDGDFVCNVDVLCAAIQTQRDPWNGLADGKAERKPLQQQEEHTDVLVLEWARKAECETQEKIYRRVGRGAIVANGWLDDQKADEMVII